MNIVDTKNLVYIELSDQEISKLLPATVVDYRFWKFRLGLMPLNDAFCKMMVSQINEYAQHFVEYNIRDYYVTEFYYHDYTTITKFKKRKKTLTQTIQESFKKIGTNIKKGI